MRKLIALIVIVFILVSVTALVLKLLKPTEFEFNRSVLSSKPVLSGEIVTNPDFNYPYRGWLSPQEIPALADEPVLYREEVDWESDGWYDNRTVFGRSDFIVIHPYKTEFGGGGRYIQQSVYLPEGSYDLVLGIADIAGEIYYARPTDCNDVGFLIKIVDEGGKETIVSDEIVNSNDRWVGLSYDITDFAGETISIRVESYAGGPCGDWAAEWAAVDYIDIIKKR